MSPGKIVTIETVALKLPRKQWKSHDINPDQTCYADVYLRHVLYITRIYFRYGSPDPELIGRYFAAGCVVSSQLSLLSLICCYFYI